MNRLRFNTLGQITEIESTKSITSIELLSQSQKKAALLHRQGIGPGQRVALSHGTSIEFFIDLLATWMTGACAVPLDSRLPDLALRNIIAEANIDLILPGNDFFSSTLPLLNRDPREALILFTSGISGAPKGVVHSWTSVEAKFSALANAIPLTDIQKTLCMLPLHFGHGLLANSLFPLLHGAHLYIGKPFHDETILSLGEIIDLHQISFLSSVPAIWKYILQFSASGPLEASLRRVHCASEPLPKKIWHQAREWSRSQQFKNVYGLTETASWIAGPDDDQANEAEGFIGKPWGAEFRTCELGLLHVKTNSLMLGYWQNHQLNATAIDGEWFNTGDQASIDSAGNISLRGRKQNVINCSGIKVFPEELELFLTSAPGVSDIAVVPLDHKISGQEIAAAVVFASSDAQMSCSRLEEWCRERLPPHQVPRRWLALENLPRTNRGKLDRRKIIGLLGG